MGNLNSIALILGKVDYKIKQYLLLLYFIFTSIFNLNFCSKCELDKVKIEACRCAFIQAFRKAEPFPTAEYIALSMLKGNTASEILFVNSNNSASYSAAPVARRVKTKEFRTAGLEMAYLLRDTDKKAFSDFTRNFPWSVASYLKDWEGKAARYYFIASRPIMYLLASFLLKPNSLQQVSAWLGNKQ